MCDKTVGDYSIALEFVPDRYKSKEMCHKIISENPFMLKYCPHVTQKMFDEAVDDFLSALNFVPDWFVNKKMVKKLFTSSYAGKNILYLDEGSGNVVFNYNEMGILSIDLNDIKIDHELVDIEY